MTTTTKRIGVATATLAVAATALVGLAGQANAFPRTPGTTLKTKQTLDFCDGKGNQNRFTSSGKVGKQKVTAKIHQSWNNTHETQTVKGKAGKTKFSVRNKSNLGRTSEKWTGKIGSRKIVATQKWNYQNLNSGKYQWKGKKTGSLRIKGKTYRFSASMWGVGQWPAKLTGVSIRNAKGKQLPRTNTIRSVITVAWIQPYFSGNSAC